MNSLPRAWHTPLANWIPTSIVDDSCMPEDLDAHVGMYRAVLIAMSTLAIHALLDALIGSEVPQLRRPRFAMMVHYQPRRRCTGCARLRPCAGSTLAKAPGDKAKTCRLSLSCLTPTYGTVIASTRGSPEEPLTLHSPGLSHAAWQTPGMQSMDRLREIAAMQELS